jgi:hypothetical protein
LVCRAISLKSAEVFRAYIFIMWTC